MKKEIISPKLDFEFDLRGFVVLKQFLSLEAVKKINQVIDDSECATNRPKFHFMCLSDIFLDVMSDKRILEICEHWIDVHFRFDHAWGIQHFPEDSSKHENLHAGQMQNKKYFQYRWYNGRPHSSCLVFGLALEPQLKGQGGFVVVPGSHNLNMEIAENYGVYNLIKDQPMEEVPWIYQPELQPGDLLIMTEALVHGTQAWKGNTRRRNLYYKYSCSFMTWLPVNDLENEKLRKNPRNDLEKRLLEPPYVSQTAGNDLIWRPSTLPQPVKPKPAIVTRIGNRIRRKLG